MCTGVFEPIGHIDIYLENLYIQPGCSSTFADMGLSSHKFAMKYFILIIERATPLNAYPGSFADIQDPDCDWSQRKNVQLLVGQQMEL